VPIWELSIVIVFPSSLASICPVATIFKDTFVTSSIAPFPFASANDLLNPANLCVNSAFACGSVVLVILSSIDFLLLSYHWASVGSFIPFCAILAVSILVQLSLSIL